MKAEAIAQLGEDNASMATNSNQTFELRVETESQRQDMAPAQYIEAYQFELQHLEEKKWHQPQTITLKPVNLKVVQNPREKKWHQCITLKPGK